MKSIYYVLIYNKIIEAPVVAGFKFFSDFETIFLVRLFRKLAFPILVFPWAINILFLTYFFCYSLI